LSFSASIAIFSNFFAFSTPECDTLDLKHENFLGYQCSKADLTSRYKSWPNVAKIDQTLQKLTKRYKSWPNFTKVDQTLQKLTKSYRLEQTL
jgi:hypothetical protein